MNPMKMKDIDTRSSSFDFKRTLPPLTSATLDFVKSSYAEGLVSEDRFYVDSELDHEELTSALLRVEQAVDISFTCPYASVRLRA